MSEKEKFRRLLNGAAKSARRKAARKKLPVAISENGEIKLIFPDKKIRIIRKSRHRKKIS